MQTVNSITRRQAIYREYKCKKYFSFYKSNCSKGNRKTKKLHSFFTAKEAKIDSCGTAPGCVVLDGLNISCGPGQVSDFESNTEIEFGRDLNNSVGVSRPRLSGVIRGQGK